MSDIIISGMEMPKDCGHCPLNVVNTIGDALVYECILTGCYLDDGYEGQIMGSCPLVPVPPHGRLIDALVRDNGIKEIPEYYEVVRDVPTIIPGDRQREGDI